MGHSVDADLDYDSRAALEQIARLAVGALKLSPGVFHLEARLSPKGPVVIETAARLAGHDGVTAWFADGTRARGSLLIGADGVNSTVRTLIDPNATPPRYVGRRVYYGYSADRGLTDRGLANSAPDYFQVVRGAAAFGYIVTAQRDIWWFARIVDDELDRPAVTDECTHRWKDELTALLRHQTPAADIVRSAHQIMVTNTYDLPHLRRWHRDRMIIIGDAAHAASPATGQGASMASSS